MFHLPAFSMCSEDRCACMHTHRVNLCWISSACPSNHSTLPGFSLLYNKPASLYACTLTVYSVYGVSPSNVYSLLAGVIVTFSSKLCVCVCRDGMGEERVMNAKLLSFFERPTQSNRNYL